MRIYDADITGSLTVRGDSTFLFTSASGIVGVGTDSPSLGKLHVVGQSSGYGFRVNNNFIIPSASVTSFNTNSSYVAILQKDAASMLLINSSNNAGNAGVQFQGAGDRGSVYGTPIYNIHIEPNAQFTEPNIILNSKNGTALAVGIGLTTPSARLHVSGSGSAVLRVDGVGQTNALYVSSSGNVGVGTNSPQFRLDVSGSGKFTSNFQISGSLTVSNSLFANNSGRVGINNTNPTYGFDANVSSGRIGDNANGYGTSLFSNGTWGYHLVGIAGEPSMFIGSNVQTSTQSLHGVTVPATSSILAFSSPYLYDTGWDYTISSIGKLQIRVNNTTQALSIPTSGIVTASRGLLVNNSLVVTGSTQITGSLNTTGSLLLVGPATITGTSGSNGGQLGAELLSTSGWTSTDWTGDYTVGFTHTTGNTTALTNTLAAVNGTYYLVSWTVTGRTAGTFTLRFGGYVSGNSATSAAVGPRATSTETLSITPTSDFDGTVIVSIKVISQGSASLTLSDLAGTSRVQFRVLSGANNHNTFIGTNAGSRTVFVTTGEGSNTALGVDALAGVTTGTRNTAVGSSAAGSTTIGVQIVAVGDSAALSNTVGGTFVAVGWGASTANVIGTSFTSVGWRAAYRSVSGSSYVAIGNVAGGSVVNTNDWVAIGNSAAFNTSTGSNWIAIGSAAAIYYSGGTESATSFSNGVYLGRLTKVATASATNEVVIGYQAEGQGSNRTVIGNSSTTYTWLGGNLLLGTTTGSSFRLDVSGSTRMTDNLYVSGASFFNTSSAFFSGQTRVVSAIFNNLGSGYSAAFLHNAGALQIWHSNSGAHIGFLASNRTDLYQSVGFNVPNFGYTVSERITVKTSNETSASTGIWIGNGITNNNIFKVYGDGTVSIGQTFSPGYALQISGSTSASGSLNVNNTLLVSGSSVIVTGSLNASGSLSLIGPATITGTSGSDGGQLGAELLSSANWTSTGWTGDYTVGFTHTIGNTTALTNTLAAVNGTYYQITYTVTGRTAGTFSIDFGGVTTSGLSATGATGPRATSTGTLSITPTTDFDGTIVISIKIITGGIAIITIRNSSGTVINEINGSTSNTNTSIGLDAGARVTTGLNNTFLGNLAGANTTTGVENSALGFRALTANTTAIRNTAFGSQALATTTIGGSNSAFGYLTLVGITTGFSNSGFGEQAGRAITTGTNNTAVGYASLYNITTTSNNTALGTFAGQYAGAGFTGPANQTSANSVYLGYLTRASASGDTNEIVIGYDTVGLGSNTTVIGNSSTVTTGIYGNLLLGTTGSTGERLQVVGDAKVTGSLNVNNSLYVSSSGNVGIGTSAPFSSSAGFGGLELVGSAPSRFGVIVNRVPVTNRSAWLVNNASGGGELYLFSNGNTNTVYLNGNGFSYFNSTAAGLGIGTLIDAGYRFVVSGSGPSGSLNVDNVLFVSGSSVIVTGSVSISSMLTLATTDPLPVSAPTGSIMVSGSGADNKPYYWNGSTWTALF